MDTLEVSNEQVTMSTNDVECVEEVVVLEDDGVQYVEEVELSHGGHYGQEEVIIVTPGEEVVEHVVDGGYVEMMEVSHSEEVAEEVVASSNNEESILPNLAFGVGGEEVVEETVDDSAYIPGEGLPDEILQSEATAEEEEELQHDQVQEEVVTDSASQMVDSVSQLAESSSSNQIKPVSDLEVVDHVTPDTTTTTAELDIEPKVDGTGTDGILHDLPVKNEAVICVDSDSEESFKDAQESVIADDHAKFVKNIEETQTVSTGECKKLLEPESSEDTSEDNFYTDKSVSPARVRDPILESGWLQQQEQQEQCVDAKSPHQSQKIEHPRKRWKRRHASAEAKEVRNGLSETTSEDDNEADDSKSTEKETTKVESPQKRGRGRPKKGDTTPSPTKAKKKKVPTATLR